VGSPGPIFIQKNQGTVQYANSTTNYMTSYAPTTAVSTYAFPNSTSPSQSYVSTSKQAPPPTPSTNWNLYGGDSPPRLSAFYYVPFNASLYPAYNSTTIAFNSPFPCMLKGMRVNLANGDLVPVESLTPGMLLKTPKGTTEVVKVYDTLCDASVRLFYPYFIPKDHYAPDIPSADLYFSGAHGYFDPILQKNMQPQFESSGWTQCEPKEGTTYIHWYHVRTTNRDQDEIYVENLRSETLSFNPEQRGPPPSLSSEDKVFDVGSWARTPLIQCS
jgi:hypothetical protein